VYGELRKFNYTECNKNWRSCALLYYTACGVCSSTYHVVWRHCL